MHFSTLLAAVASLSAVVSASPITSRQSNTTVPTSFYLVTTDQSTSAGNSSALQNVSLTTLFSPYYQTNYILRLIEPGYESVPTFNISKGVLHSEDGGPHGVGEYVYNSTAVECGSELEFQPAYQGKGDLSLKGGFLLAVNGSAVGWTICVEELGQRVVCYESISLTHE